MTGFVQSSGVREEAVVQQVAKDHDRIACRSPLEAGLDRDKLGEIYKWASPDFTLLW